MKLLPYPMFLVYILQHIKNEFLDVKDEESTQVLYALVECKNCFSIEWKAYIKLATQDGYIHQPPSLTTDATWITFKGLWFLHINKQLLQKELS
jgi:hypothetical protein